MRVTLKNGKKAIIIIHIEIQSEYESNFEERMYIYHYRIYDKYKMERGEQRGSLSNARQSILQVLEIRFQSVPNEISARLNSISDLPRLQELLGISVTISSVDDFINVISYNSTNI